MKTLFTNKKVSEKGFSLIELMIVVAIIGILAAIAVPTFNNFQKKARNTEAKNGLGALYTTLTAYNAEYGNYGTGTDLAGFSHDTGGNYGIGFAGGTSGGTPGTAPNATCRKASAAAGTALSGSGTASFFTAAAIGIANADVDNFQINDVRNIYQLTGTGAALTTCLWSGTGVR